MSDTYTCITCRVAFKDNEIQRQHYKSDWHRYNLKRKIAELPPVTAEDFINKVLSQRNESAATINKFCDCCRKSFNNENSFMNHLSSKKHQMNLVSKDHIESNKKLTAPNDEPKDNDSDGSIEELDSDEWDEDGENPVVDNVCLFCSHRSRSLIRNLRHMSIEHSFFIPDVEFCVNIKGLIIYLGEKVYQGNMCLWCNESGRSFHSSEAAQAHMRDKGHCKMLHEGAVLAEYEDFYDYSSSYPDEELNVDIDEEIPLNTIDGTDYQLILPSGAAIGHRSLLRYYKQSFNPNSVALPVRKSNKVNKVLHHYRALGWTDTPRELALKKARDIKYMHRVQNKWYTQLGVKANKHARHHLRAQVLF